jgi:hypothetical protein
MDAFRKLTTLAAALLVALTIGVGPAVAADDDGGGGSGERERIQLAETPRDQLGLLLLGALGAGGALALVNARRQLRGERPQATGEFRWR